MLFLWCLLFFDIFLCCVSIGRYCSSQFLVMIHLRVCTPSTRSGAVDLHVYCVDASGLLFASHFCSEIIGNDIALLVKN